MGTGILVSSMVARSERERPTLNSGPFFLMKKLVQSDVGLVFSKDITTLNSKERLYLHLSIAHPTDPEVGHSWILPRFEEILGRPDHVRNVIFPWTADPRVPGIVHHFFWEVPGTVHEFFWSVPILVNVGER